jgi:methyl-accepting chemotaxis protein
MANKRFNFLINPPLQTKVIASFLGLGIIMMLMNFLTNYFIIHRILEKSESLSQSEEVSNLIVDIWTLTSASTVIMSVFIIAVFCFYGLLFSHRIAGPIFNLKRSIDRLIQGDQNVVIRYRKNDYFQDLCIKMNELIEKRLQPPQK